MVIYLTTNLINGKKYVGKDSKNCKSYLGSGKYLKKAIKKYGKANFKKEVLQECGNLEELNQAEVQWINNLNCKQDPNYYNVIDTLTPNRYGKRLTKEHKDRISKAHKGKTLTPEHRDKISKAHKGIKRGKRDRKVVDKIARANTGKKRSTKIKKKISEAKKGIPNVHLRKAIIQIELKTGKIVNKFEKIIDVKNFGFNSNAVQNCLRGTTKTSGGYIWKYREYFVDY